MNNNDGVDQLKDLSRRMLEGVQMVKRGLYLRLIRRLEDTYGLEKAKWLAAAIINELFSDLPSNEEGREFLQLNKDNVRQEISNLRDDRETRLAVTQAVRVRGIIRHTLGDSPQKDLVDPLEKLRKLGILIPGGETPEPDSFLSMARAFQGGGDEDTKT